MVFVIALRNITGEVWLMVRLVTQIASKLLFDIARPWIEEEKKQVTRGEEG